MLAGTLAAVKVQQACLDQSWSCVRPCTRLTQTIKGHLQCGEQERRWPPHRHHHRTTPSCLSCSRVQERLLSGACGCKSVADRAGCMGWPAASSCCLPLSGVYTCNLASAVGNVVRRCLAVF